jgi:ATP-dependent Clp protease protease subunit
MDKEKIYLYGYVCEYRWDEDEEVIIPKEVREKLDKCKAEEVEIHINSYGGETFSGVAIYNLIKQSGKRADVYIDGIAASAASIIAMAGNRIVMPDCAMMMIHRAWTFAFGNGTELAKVADTLLKIDEAVLNSYTGRFNGTKEELGALLDGETWMTAEEANEKGFCDEVIASAEPNKTEKEQAKTKALLGYSEWKKNLQMSARAKPKGESPKPNNKDAQTPFGKKALGMGIASFKERY